MALTENDRLPPEQRLQGAPGFAADIEKKTATRKEESASAITAGAVQPKDALYEIDILRRHWNDVLANGPVDQTGRRYGMPIEKAKEEILKQGLPARPHVADSRMQYAREERMQYARGRTQTTKAHRQRHAFRRLLPAVQLLPPA